MSGENEHDLDPAALSAEADSVELPPSDAPAAPQAPAAVDDGAAWSELTPGIVTGLCLLVCPAWKVTTDEQGALADALAPVLDQLFPGGLGDSRHAAYFRLLAVTVGVVGSRFDPSTGKLAPLRERPAERRQDPAAGEDGEPSPATTGGGFSTSGGHSAAA